VVVAVLCGFLNQALVYLLLPSTAYVPDPQETVQACLRPLNTSRTTFYQF
jgi:hypothetical protein